MNWQMNCGRERGEGGCEGSDGGLGERGRGREVVRVVMEGGREREGGRL